MENLTIIIFILFVFVIIFLLLREVNCWYWKINERISLMMEQNNLLRKLVDAGKTMEMVKTIDPDKEKIEVLEKVQIFNKDLPIR